MGGVRQLHNRHPSSRSSVCLFAKSSASIQYVRMERSAAVQSTPSSQPKEKAPFNPLTACLCTWQPLQRPVPGKEDLRSRLDFVELVTNQPTDHQPLGVSPCLPAQNEEPRFHLASSTVRHRRGCGRSGCMCRDERIKSPFAADGRKSKKTHPQKKNATAKSLEAAATATN